MKNWNKLAQIATVASAVIAGITLLIVIAQTMNPSPDGSPQSSPKTIPSNTPASDVIGDVNVGNVSESSTVVIGNNITIENSNSVQPTSTDTRDWVLVKGIEYLAVSEYNTITCEVEVLYNLSNSEKGLLAIYGNCIESDKLTELTGGSFIIDRQNNKHIFEVEINVPDWPDFYITANIMPFPFPEEELTALAVSEELSIPLKDIYNEKYDLLLAIG